MTDENNEFVNKMNEALWEYADAVEQHNTALHVLRAFEHDVQEARRALETASHVREHALTTYRSARSAFVAWREERAVKKALMPGGDGTP